MPDPLRFKTPYRQRRYIFRSRKDVDQSDWKIKPHAYANTEGIIDSWDDICASSPRSSSRKQPPRTSSGA